MTDTNQRWLVTGATGQLGAHAVYELRMMPDIVVHALSRSPFPDSDNVASSVLGLDDLTALEDCVRQLKPTHILHFGAMTAVGECYKNPEAAQTINVTATALLAKLAGDSGARFLFSSTDMVFDGTSAPYTEQSVRKPLSRYGQSKAAAEDAVLAANESAVILRPPLMFGYPRVARQTTFVQQMANLRDEKNMTLFHDEYRTPAALVDVANAAIVIAQSDYRGILHVPGPERLSRLEMVSRFADVAGLSHNAIESVSRTSIQFDEPRPEDLSLDGGLLKHYFPTIRMRMIGPDTCTEFS